MTERERINEHWRTKYVQARNAARKRLCALPVGTVVDAEQWYGDGWATCEYTLRELAGITRPIFKLLRSRGDSLRAVKVR